MYMLVMAQRREKLKGQLRQMIPGPTVVPRIAPLEKPSHLAVSVVQPARVIESGSPAGVTVVYS